MRLAAHGRQGFYILNVIGLRIFGGQAAGRVAPGHAIGVAWRAEGELLRGVERISHLPAVLIHGRLDLSSPLMLPGNWHAHGALPNLTSCPERASLRRGGLDRVVKALGHMAALAASNRYKA